MKLLRTLLPLLLLPLLSACSGSGAYRGAWKATSADGTHSGLVFDAQKLRMTDPAGKVTEFDYRQNSVEISNSIRKYGIQLGDGRAYKLIFPKSGDENVAVMVDGNGVPVYVLGRKGYLSYEDVYKL